MFSLFAKNSVAISPLLVPAGSMLNSGVVVPSYSRIYDYWSKFAIVIPAFAAKCAGPASGSCYMASLC